MSSLLPASCLAFAVTWSRLPSPHIPHLHSITLDSGSDSLRLLCQLCHEQHAVVKSNKKALFLLLTNESALFPDQGQITSSSCGGCVGVSSYSRAWAWGVTGELPGERLTCVISPCSIITSSPRLIDNRHNTHPSSPNAPQCHSCNLFTRELKTNWKDSIHDRKKNVQV